jgi:histidinol dehydrogenase
MVKIQQIRFGDDSAARSIDAIRQRLSVDGDIVSPAGRSMTIEVFGEPLSASESVRRICRDVREQGFSAAARYTRSFDGVAITPETVRVGWDRIRQAHQEADSSFLATVRRVRANIDQFQTGVLNRDAHLSVSGKYDLEMRYRPLRRVGICIPGGAAAYPSTLLMTAVPAQAAGVRELAVVSPPTANGANNPDLLAVCHELGIDEVYQVGGAQGVAALAYGAGPIRPVDKIVGPGNLFVTLAKREVFGHVDIDMLAGPSELVILADSTADPDYVAADMIAQAEHSPGASMLVTWAESLADSVLDALDRQLDRLERGRLARDSLEQFGAIIMVRNGMEAVAVANLIAPEHLEIMAEQANLLAGEIESAGAIFIGSSSPVALGDYVAGPSHVLPTGGSARFASGLSANDFLKRSSVIQFTAEGLEDVAGDVRLLAAKEGLTAHSASVDIRIKKPLKE